MSARNFSQELDQPILTGGRTVSLGKYGAFPANLIIGRPYHHTFEILDKADGASYSELRIIPTAELHAELLSHEYAETADSAVKTESKGQEDEPIDIVGEDGQYVVRNNRLTIDDPSRQALKAEEIEMLKKGMSTGSGKDIIAKIMASHQALDEKTEFSLAKYTLRKSKKYLKRFTLLPLDVSMLGKWMIEEKDPARIMDLREEHLGLMLSWANVHGGLEEAVAPATTGSGRWLVVDETGGMITAAMAERMDLLYRRQGEEDNGSDQESAINGHAEQETATDAAQDDQDDERLHDADTATTTTTTPAANTTSRPNPPRKKKRKPLPDAMSATSNTLTVIHAAHQPNLSLFSYFDFDPNQPSDHPLYTHLKTLSWLQLLHPESTATYTQKPATLTDEELAALKPSKRGLYHRKHRRFARTVRIIEETRAGGFDGLVVATVMDPTDVLNNLVPLVRGGGHVVVYSPSEQPLAELADTYSTARKAALLQAQAEGQEPAIPSEDFPLDPRLLLAPTLQTARAKEWQVLPGRTHPMMTGRGGPEGYLFTGTRVIPSDEAVAARGVYNRKRKREEGAVPGTPDAAGEGTAKKEEV